MARNTALVELLLALVLLLASMGVACSIATAQARNLAGKGQGPGSPGPSGPTCC